VAVPAVTVTPEQWASGYEVTGTVRARTTTSISAKVMGYVRQVNAQVGDHVRAGQTLVTIEAQDLEAHYRGAEAGVEEARAAMPEVESAVAAAKAQLELAQATFRRMQDLFNKRSISNQEFDEAVAKRKAAEANYEMAVSKRSQLRAKIAQAEQERTAARVTRSYATITAPFAGIVTAKSVEPGTLATPGTPLLTIEQQGGFRLEAPVEEARLGSIRVGMPVTVSIESLDRTIQARVSEIVPAVDPASRSYTVKIDLPASPQLRSGLFGRARFAQGSRQVLAVPASAVAERGQLRAVMVAENGVARTRLITTGERLGEQVEVLSGLTPGEKVIAPAPANLADGARGEVRS
jgi:RND family efflux transporter MFP subunit